MKKIFALVILIMALALNNYTLKGQEVRYGVVHVENVDELVNAVNNGNPGDIIQISAGVYKLDENQQLRPKKGMIIKGSGMGMTTLSAVDKWNPGLEGLPAHEVDQTKVNKAPYLFRLENTSNVKILDMTLTAPKLHGAIFALNCHNLEFFKLKIHDFIWSSILTYDINGFKIHDCHFHDAGGHVKWMGAAVFSNRTVNGEYYNNKITTSPDNNNRFVGFKGRGSSHCRIHHNTVHQSFMGFAVEYMHADQHFMEIDHNNFNGTISIPGHNEEHTDLPGFYTFRIHHNYLSKSYAIEGARNYVFVENNYFDFPVENDGGRLYTEFRKKGIQEHVYIRNNQVRNPGRAIMWSTGAAYKNVQIINNHIKAKPTVTPRKEGLIHFVEDSDFKTIAIKNNIVECIDRPRPLLQNDETATAVIENNLLINVMDTTRYENGKNPAAQGLTNPLHFKCGYKGEYMVDGWNIIHFGVD
jgi:hypothetical protein